jgi:RimJ/RimL family protein N-acetyltransferase
MIESELLYLTPISKEDTQLFVEIYTDPQVMQFVGPVLNKDKALKLFKQCVNQVAKQHPQYLFYVINSKHSSEKFGIVGLLWNQQSQKSIELGVMIAKTYINKAYAFKALKLLVKYVFMKFNVQEVVMICEESNTAASRISKGLGFRKKEIFVDKKTKQRKIIWQKTVKIFGDIKK